MNQNIKIGDTALDLDSGTVISTTKRVANIGTLERQSSAWPWCMCRLARKCQYPTSRWILRRLVNRYPVKAQSPKPT